jgi:HK97 family phage portal protein
MPNRVHGVGPLEWVGRNLTSASALEKYAGDIARQGVWAVLKHPANLNRKQSGDLQAGWVSARKRADGAPAVLSGGVELETLSLSPKDMALLDLRVFDEQRIASALGVPPFLIGLPNPGGMTYSNSTSLFDFHWRAMLRPSAQSFADPLSTWLLPRGTSIEFNPDRYVQPSLYERAQAYALLHGITDEMGRTAINLDEVRVAERLQPYETETGSVNDVGHLTGAKTGQ